VVPSDPRTGPVSGGASRPDAERDLTQADACPLPSRAGDRDREKASFHGVGRGRLIDMPSRALSFGLRAEAYERFRPGYPVELFDLVTTYAGEPVETALEIGAGTGKATRLFAERGVTVTAIEPDGDMLAELRKHVPASVRTVQAAFEDLQPGERYELVYAAAALHWTNPDGRCARIAARLKPGGVVASCGGPVQLADPVVAETVRAARAPFLDNDEIPSPDGTPPEDMMQWPGTEFQRSGWFSDVRQCVIERPLTMRAREYIGYLSTVSAYLELPVTVQQQVYRRIEQVLPETVEIAADIIVHLARRSGAPG
jgi:SAM-dependent methyltransferase